jgi:hypothetical protein
VASCASASSGSSVADRVKPNAAPNPSREIALRREIISGLILSLISCLPLAHGSNWTDGELNAITSMSERRRSQGGAALELNFAVVMVIEASDDGE